jgi:hypothetical protein
MTRHILLAAVLMPLGACASVGDAFEQARLADQANPAPCPNAFVLSDAARLIEFAGEPSLDAVAWSAEVTDVRSSCRYAEDSPIRAEVSLDLAVGRGPAAEGETFELGYFVAVTRTNRDLIAKEEFTVPVTVRDGRVRADLTEDIEGILIPRAGENTSGTNFEIAVGLTLTTEQLLYNRSGASLKFPDL